MANDQQLAQQELKRRGLLGYMEPVLTMGSSILAEPLSGLAGLAALPFGRDVAAATVEGVRNDLTYQPRSQEGQQGLQAVGSALAPIGEALEGGSRYLGDATYDITGSEGLAAAAYSAPTAALELLGLKGVNALGKSGKLGKPLEIGDIGGQGIGKQRGIFAGVKAKSADLNAQGAAEELANRGISRDEIWNKTGWYKDVDDAWKFEIDDSGAKIKGSGRDWNAEMLKSFEFGEDGKQIRQAILKEKAAYKPPHEMSGTVINQVMDHDELFDAYRDTKAIGYKRDEGLELGSAQYSPNNDTITVSPMNKGVVKSPLLHETQHAIQQREGFARGGSPDYFKGRKEVRELLESQRSELSNSVGYDDWEFNLASDNPSKYDVLMKQVEASDYSGKPFYDEFAKTLDKTDQAFFTTRMARFDKDITDASANSFGSPTENYKRLAGEAEARNVQTRMDMTPEQRRAKPPWETLDVPEDELIVRRDGGVSMSVNQKAAIAELEKRGVDLPMDHASRMQRAKDMGFDTENTYYHGAAKRGYVESTDIEAFDPDKIGDSWNQDRDGFFFTSDKNEANYYASSDRDYRNPGEGGGAVYPVNLKMKNPLIIDSASDFDLAGEGGTAYWDTRYNELLESAKSGGHDSVKLIDRGVYEDGYQEMNVVFDPKNIRSVNAAFNPADSTSANLLKGVGGLMVGEKLLNQDDEQL